MGALEQPFSGSDHDRFWSKVRIGGPGCWEWTAYRNANGYGMAFIKSKMHRAHRVAFAMLREDPGALCVLHRCDNPACVRPDHLFLGTRTDNMADMDAKGRRRNGDMRGEGNGQSKLTAAAVVEIRARYAAGGVTHADLAAEFGVKKAAVCHVISRRNWSHVPDAPAPAAVGRDYLARVEAGR